MREYVDRLILDPASGMIDRKAIFNVYWMLKMHPEMKGVIGVNAGGDLVLNRNPPWGPGGEVPRLLAATDVTFARMWLEQMGMMPSKKATMDAIRAVAGDLTVDTPSTSR